MIFFFTFARELSPLFYILWSLLNLFKILKCCSGRGEPLQKYFRLAFNVKLVQTSDVARELFKRCKTKFFMK